MADIEIDNITKSFGGFVALERVDFNVADGEFLALLGPSGCGKTTLLLAERSKPICAASARTERSF